MTALKNAVRHHLAGDNADIPHLFTPLGRAYLAQLTLAEGRAASLGA
jgi:hypothetical protein